ncbi:MAG: DUF2177 family protein [Hyphomicrobiales bacterium]|nr:DUF2177 family protein [Rhodoblastus sp.]MCB9998175.1 DUF2177 family protein [Methylobacteriaceae bacterium]MCC2100400.1 DUF2177 family protein [Hyphomicrobiales bacterium]HRY01814.1 DUF2177 family protein [Beijerinckiaceae bacterium]MCB1523157.1 DUF2177 family protein [Rhodoblastus sp.]
MLRWFVSYLAVFLAMGALDAVWLTLAGERFYRANIGELLAPGFRLAPAAAFYLVYVFGLVVLAVRPGDEGQSIGRAMAYGAVYGLCAYATYDLTNQATMKVWPTVVTVVDMAWGMTLSACAAAVGAWVAGKLA